MKSKSIFELTLIQYCKDKPKYPKFEIFRWSLGYFSSLKKTEGAMKKCIAEKADLGLGNQPLFGFIIKEFVVDVLSYQHAKNRKSYLPDGTLWDECPVHEDARLEEFLGRPEENVRFRKGDLVEVLDGDTVTLEIVYGTPRSPEGVRQIKKHAEEEGFRICLDESDDSYTTLTYLEYEHSHPNSVNLFPVRLPVNEKLRKKLEAVLFEWEHPREISEA